MQVFELIKMALSNKGSQKWCEKSLCYGKITKGDGRVGYMIY